jgi:hypothetical protein
MSPLYDFGQMIIRSVIKYNVNFKRAGGLSKRVVLKAGKEC